MTRVKSSLLTRFIVGAGLASVAVGGALPVNSQPFSSSVLGSGPISARPSGLPPKMPSTSGFSPELQIYLAKGEADACGLGCDTWIAVEGTFDNDAGARVRKFLVANGDQNLPVFFHSPGGSMEQAITIGRMFRGRKNIAGIGHPTSKPCERKEPASLNCEKVTRAPLQLSYHDAVCASACVYALIGASRREISPFARLGVHSPKNLYFGAGQSNEPAANAKDRQLLAKMTAENNEMARQYAREMGIDGDLIKISNSVEFEKMRFLTREEIYRLNIDRRERIETDWSFSKKPAGFSATNSIFRLDRRSGEFSYIAVELICRGADFDLLYVGPSSPNTQKLEIAFDDIVFKTELLNYSPDRTQQVRGARVSKAVARRIGSSHHISINQRMNSNLNDEVIPIGTTRYSSAIASLNSVCPDLPSAPERSQHWGLPPELSISPSR